MKFRQWVGVVMVTACVGGASWLFLVHQSPSAAPPAVETTQTPSAVVPMSPEPSEDWPPVSSTPTPSPVESIDRVKASEIEQLRVPGVLNASFGGAIAPNDANQLVPPTSSEVFRWAERGLPGCPSRDTVFALGHTVRAGGGVFDRLQEVEPGQLVILETETGTVRYKVEKTSLYDRDTLPDADEVYADVPGRLVLVGCFLNPDGSLQTRNFVVMARIVDC